MKKSVVDPGEIVVLSTRGPEQSVYHLMLAHSSSKQGTMWLTLAPFGCSDMFIQQFSVNCIFNYNDRLIMRLDQPTPGQND